MLRQFSKFKDLIKQPSIKSQLITERFVSIFAKHNFSCRDHMKVCRDLVKALCGVRQKIRGIDTLCRKSFLDGGI